MVVVVNLDIAERVAVLLPDAHVVVNDDPDAGRMRSLRLDVQPWLCKTVHFQSGW